MPQRSGAGSAQRSVSLSRRIQGPTVEWVTTVCVVLLADSERPPMTDVLRCGDPHHPDYLDEEATRTELTRTFDVCNGCRRCVDRCDAFPTLFDLLDQRDEAGDLTPFEQDRVVGSCHHCGLCVMACPYAPGVARAAGDEAQPVDVPRLMLRARAMNVVAGHASPSDRRATRTLGAVDRLGSLGVRFDTAANRVVSAEPGSRSRRITERVTGVSAIRLLAPYARERFSTWFRRRPRVTLRKRRSRVTVYPTCLVEYHEVGIGKDLVAVYERNGIECTISTSGCCGAPSLHGGDLDRFRAIAKRNVERFSSEVADGVDLIVPQAACASVLRRAYPEHVSPDQRGDAELVAQHVRDAAEYLLELHQSGDARLDTDFAGELPDSITYHAACHQRVDADRYAARDLLRLTGARVDLVQQCAGPGETWGLRPAHADAVSSRAALLVDRLDRDGATVVVSECHRANLSISEHSVPDAERSVAHPIQVLARAYGISDHL